MSTQADNSLFVDVADAIGLGDPVIVEKDYYVVQLLKLISILELEHHQVIFTGGTALAKSAIKTYRMSEDIDIKLVPNQPFLDLTSRNAKRKARKTVKQYIESLIAENGTFSIEERASVKDEYRYFSFEIRYPQAHQKAPCLRPFIKLEFIESTLLDKPESKSIQSIYAEVLKTDIEVNKMACAAILETQSEKLLSMMRRTASAARNPERDDDETLIRHIYDTYHIQQAQQRDWEIREYLGHSDLYITRVYRHLVENAFMKIKKYRAIATRYDRLARNYQSMVALAFSLMWLPMWTD